MEPSLVLRRNRMIFHHCTKRNDRAIKWFSKSPFTKWFSNLPRHLGHFADNNSIPDNQPTIFDPSVPISVEWNSSESDLETHSPFVQTPSVRQLILSHLFSQTFYWADICRHICLQVQTCSLDIREDADDHTTDPNIVLCGNLCTQRGLSFQQKDFVSWSQNLSMVFFRQSVSARQEQERTIVFVSLLLNTVQLLSTDNILAFSFLRWHSSLCDF